jgi:hypothetical protein
MIPRTEALDFGHDRELFDVADVLIAGIYAAGDLCELPRSLVRGRARG